MKARKISGLTLAFILLLLASGLGQARGTHTNESLATIHKNSALPGTAPWFINNVDSTQGVGLYVSVAIEPINGTTYISYFDDTNGNLKMAKYVGSGGNCGSNGDWSCETVDDNIDDVGKYSSIAIDPTTNLPVIAYWQSTVPSPSDLKLATAWSGGWDIIYIDSEIGRYASLQIDSTGVAHIAYYLSYGSYGLAYARHVGGGMGNCGGNNYQCETIVDDLDVGLFPSLALDEFDQPRIAYYDKDNGNLMYAQLGTPGNCGPGDTWECYQVSSGSDAGLYASLDVDNDNLSHIAYYDVTNGKLMYAAQVGTGGNCGPLDSWQCDEIATMGSQGTHPRTRDVSLAIDNAGWPIIAYSWYYGDPFSARGFSWARPAAALGLQSGNCGPQDLWQCEGIEGGFSTGNYSAVAVNPSGLATIAYNYGEYFSSLRVTYQKYHQTFLPMIVKNQ